MKYVFIRARSDGKIYKSDVGHLEVATSNLVVFESDQCQEIGRVIDENDKEHAEELSGDLTECVVIRKLTEKDIKRDEELKIQARENLAKCREIVIKHQLPMELLDADLSFDDKKMTFYFSAPGRVDFRLLVSELASTFQKLIRLQQVGARDRARCKGGIGRCGQDFCCKKYLKGELDCISMDMAYDQNLAQMGSNRVTGACGKLMCCLKYELEFYRERRSKMPALGSKIKTEKGTGTVINQNVLKNKVLVELLDKTYLEVDC